MARIYTRTGDLGETSLGDGSRVAKSTARVDLYGDVDELNSLLGMAVALLRDEALPGQKVGLDLVAVLQDIQSRLFDLGSVLANPTLCAEIASGHVDHTVPAFPQAVLEQHIDALDEHLQPLRQFVLPGGRPGSAQLHVARSVCRRVERKCVQLAVRETIPADAIAWLNRLSDFLFTAARAVNAAAAEADIPWRPAVSPPAEGPQES